MEKFEFKPKQWVLVRDNEDERWSLAQYSHYNENATCEHRMVMNVGFFHCIPYEGNEHLLGTKDPYAEPFLPKDGDFVTYTYHNGNVYVAIFQCTDSNLIDNYYVDICLKNVAEEFLKKVSYDNGFDMGYSERRHSTEEEKNLLLSKLHENGKDWDAEKKEIVDIEWVPTEGEKYYYPNFDVIENLFVVNTCAWHNDTLDTGRKLKNFVFSTYRECKSLCDRFNETINNVK